MIEWSCMLETHRSGVNFCTIFVPFLIDMNNLINLNDGLWVADQVSNAVFAIARILCTISSSRKWGNFGAAAARAGSIVFFICVCTVHRAMQSSIKFYEFSFFSSDSFPSTGGFLAVASGAFLPYSMSTKSAANTRTAPSHWRAIRTFPNSRTEHRTVKNFRVVVTTEQASGPKLATIRKMKNWPSTPHTAISDKWVHASGCRMVKYMNSLASPEEDLYSFV